MVENSQHPTNQRIDGHLTDPDSDGELEARQPTPGPLAQQGAVRINLNRPDPVVRQLNFTPIARHDAEASTSTGDIFRTPDGARLPPITDDPSQGHPDLVNGAARETHSNGVHVGSTELPPSQQTTQEEVNQALIDQVAELSREISAIRTQKSHDPSRRRKESRDDVSRRRRRVIIEDDLPPVPTPSTSRRVTFRDHSPESSPERTTVEIHDSDSSPESDEPYRRSPRRSRRREREKPSLSLREEIEEMKSLVRRATSSAPEVDELLAETENSPFTRRILRTKVPVNDKLRLPTYDGTEDPAVFLRAFNVKISRADFGRATEDQGRCQLFVESLRGEAQAWFTRLPENSIGSFEDLKTLFLNQYMIYREDPPAIIDLCAMKQGPKETVRDFIKRFKDVYSKIRISDKLAIDALITALRRDTMLYNDLSIRKPYSMNDALYRAHTHIRMEDAPPRPSEPSGSVKQRQESKSEIRPEPYQHYDRESKKKDKSKEDVTFAAVEPAPKKPWTNTYKRDPNLPTSPWCDYHNRPGHKTEDCRHLQEELLNRYLKEISDSKAAGSNPKARDASLGPAPKRDRDEDDQEELPPPPPRRRINMIMGGVADADDSIRSIQRSINRIMADGSSRENTFQKELSFSKDDLRGVAVPHNDLLVIELQVGDCDIQRILVDTGSSVDVISVSTLQKMGLSGEEIKPKTKVLTAFGGETVRTVGTIKLPVSVGGVTKITKFDVVEKPTIYNAILGTPWLYSMQAVASTYHQCIKFPTTRGYFTVRGDQSMSRKCFMIGKKQQSVSEPPTDLREAFIGGSNPEKGQSAQILRELLWRSERLEGTPEADRRRI